uniref:Uncharacterized protein n=1 Tax=Kalanchoe fedtschenkoi TaxID=63787 RepID=A0A7N0U4J4_KALFE
MTLHLIKIEEGLCTGGVIFSEHGDGDKKKPERKEDGIADNATGNADDDEGFNGESEESDTDDDEDANKEDHEMSEDE